MTLDEAILVAKSKGYEPCTNRQHGFGKQITTGKGITGPCKFMICPIIQIGFPKDTFQYLSKEDFIREAELQERSEG